ncbi:MAG: hypothetical protein U0R52_03655 [Solirubrobacterales bacterium]
MPAEGTSARRMLSLVSAVAVLLSALLASGGVSRSASTFSSSSTFSPAASASSGEPGIGVGVGMAGVRIGMTRAQARHILGRPRGVEVQTNSAFGPGHPVAYRYGGLAVEFWKGAPRTPSGSKGPDRRLRVASIYTTRRSLRTRRGVGVGSKEHRVKARVTGVRCQTIRSNGRRYRNCHTGSYTCKPPKWVLGDLPCHVTAFILNRKHGRVVRVQVGWLGSPSGTFGF